MTATASRTSTGGLRIAGTVRSDTAASGTVVVRAGTQELGRAEVGGGTFALTLPAGVLDVGTHALGLSFARTRTHLAASMTLAVTVAAAGEPATPTQPPASGGETRAPATLTARVARLRRHQVRIRVEVQAVAGRAEGRVELVRGGEVVARAKLRRGKATMGVPRRRLGGGQTTLRARYAGSDTVAAATGTVTFRMPQG